MSVLTGDLVASPLVAADEQVPCQSVDPELFFSDVPATIAVAKAVCASCPMRAACLDGALSRREAAGVWGGELISQGSIVALKRGRGRPRKEPAPLEVTVLRPQPDDVAQHAA